MIDYVTLSKTTYISPFWIARIYANLDEKDKAFAYLDKAYQERSGSLSWLNVDPKLDKLRTDERFKELLSRMGLSR